MKVLYDINQFKAEHSVTTIGTFDGIHLGHEKILKALVEKAKTLNSSSVVLTFDLHPRKIVNEKNKPSLINTTEEKIELLKKYDIDYAIVLKFTKEFSKLSSLEFTQKYLIEKLRVKHLIMGFNHHFGKNRQGDATAMKNYADQFQFGLSKIEAFELDNIKISSSKIRKAINAGEIHIANQYLGYDFFITGKVIEGNKIGREINFPTANLDIDNIDKILPGNGVYATEVIIDRQVYLGMMNIGIRPTVSEGEPRKTAEIHIIDFDNNIYGKKIKIILKLKIRNEKKFNNLEELKKQLEKDKAFTLKLLNY